MTQTQFSGRDLVRLETTNQNTQRDVFNIKQCFANSIDALLKLQTQSPSRWARKRAGRLINRIANQAQTIEQVFSRHEAKLSVQQKRQLSGQTQNQQNQEYVAQPQMQGSNS